MPCPFHLCLAVCKNVGYTTVEHDFCTTCYEIQPVLRDPFCPAEGVVAQDRLYCILIVIIIIIKVGIRWRSRRSLINWPPSWGMSVEKRSALDCAGSRCCSNPRARPVAGQAPWPSPSPGRVSPETDSRWPRCTCPRGSVVARRGGRSNGSSRRTGGCSRRRGHVCNNIDTTIKETCGIVSQKALKRPQV